MTEAPAAPWPALAVRAFLLNSTRVADLFGDRVSTRSPADVGALHVVVQSPSAPGLDRVAYGLYRPLVIVEARAAVASEAGGDVEYEVMTAAGVLAAVLSGARNVTHEKARWSALDVTGPYALPVDETRGVAVFRGATQADVALHARR